LGIVGRSAVAIHRIADGKIVEHWAGKDELGFMQKLGVIDLPGHAPERQTVPSGSEPASTVDR